MHKMTDDDFRIAYSTYLLRIKEKNSRLSAWTLLVSFYIFIFMIKNQNKHEKARNIINMSLTFSMKICDFDYRNFYTRKDTR